MSTTKEICPSCQKEIEYIEFECDEAFTAPIELRFMALNVWGAYSAPKEVVCKTAEFVHFKFLGNGRERLVKMLGFDREKFIEKHGKLCNTTQACKHTDKDGKSCSADGNAIFSPFQPYEPIGYYCDEHCYENGACPGCYQFLSGWESFDFSESGFCEECEQEFSDEDDIDYSDEDEFYEP